MGAWYVKTVSEQVCVTGEPGVIFISKACKLKLSGIGVYFTISLISVGKNTLCGKFDCQKALKLKAFSYEFPHQGDDACGRLVCENGF